MLYDNIEHLIYSYTFKVRDNSTPSYFCDVALINKLAEKSIVFISKEQEKIRDSKFATFPIQKNEKLSLKNE